MHIDMSVCRYVDMSVCRYDDMSWSICRYVISVCRYVDILSICLYVGMTVCRYVDMSTWRYDDMSICRYVGHVDMSICRGRYVDMSFRKDNMSISCLYVYMSYVGMSIYRYVDMSICRSKDQGPSSSVWGPGMVHSVPLTTPAPDAASNASFPVNIGTLC